MFMIYEINPQSVLLEILVNPISPLAISAQGNGILIICATYKSEQTSSAVAFCCNLKFEVTSVLCFAALQI
jgi:hypothetical protein